MATEEEQQDGLMSEAPYTPEEENITELTTDEVDMIERLVWAEAGTEDETGRNAVRGVILNRLSSDRFPNTVEEVINQRGQFEPISKYGSTGKIPVPPEDLENGKYEFNEYLNVGEDASGGRTFFVNKNIAAKRGTDFNGTKPLTIGRHTFYSGYPGQAPVKVSPMSHNVTIVDSRPGTVEQLASGMMSPVIEEQNVAPASDEEVAVANTASPSAVESYTPDTAATPSPRLSNATDNALTEFTTRDRSGVDSQTQSAFGVESAGTSQNYNAEVGRVETGILDSIRQALGFADGGMAVSGNQEIEEDQPLTHPYGDGSSVSAYEPTLREQAKYKLGNFISNLTGMDERNAIDYAERWTGNPNATDGSYGIGIADFTPAGIAFGIEEAGDDFTRAKNTDDKLGMGLSVVAGGLSILEAFPLTKGVFKGAKKGLDSLADIAANMDPATVGSMGGNAFSKKAKTALAQEPVTPESVTTLAEEVFVAPKATNMNYNNTVTAYKLFRVDPNRPGELFPLYVDSKNGIKPGEWTEAISGEIDPKTGKVKSSIGNLAYRPGWHAGDLPIATHIGPTHKITADQAAKLEADGANNVFSKKNSATGEVEYFERLRAEDTVWAEVQMPAGVDWQSVADSNARIMKSGQPEAKSAHITDQIPYGGYYRYKTNPNMTGEWLISGNIKVNRVLTDAEVSKINTDAGMYGQDMPRTPYTQVKAEPLENTPDAGPAQAVLDIRAAQMELDTKDRLQPSGKDPLFNLTPEGYEKTLPEQSEVYVPRQPTGTNKPLPKNNRAASINDKIEAISDRLAERMKPWLGTEAQYFYHTGPIVDKALDMGFSKEEIYSWLRDFADSYAATSPRTKTADNLRNATLVMTKKHLGIPYDEIIGPNKGQRNEKGYAMIINKKGDVSTSGNVAKGDGLHRMLLDDLEQGGIDPNTNPKPYTFAENVYGNLDGVTVDTHAVRGALDAMNEVEPGSIPIDFISPKYRDQYLADPSSLDPATMIDDSIGSQKIGGVDMQTEYAVFSDVYRRTAEKLGVSPAEAQSMGWFGSGDSTGLASELKSVARLIEDRIDVTAQGLGKPKEEVFRMLIGREIPVLQLFATAGAGAAAVGSMDDQMEQFSKGGLTQGESEKAIRTKEGKEMADKAFKLDFSEADLNDDGKLSAYEKVRGEAVQKAIEEDGIMKAAHGGMACGCEGDCDGSCEGTMPGMIVGVDPVSGNEIPLGSDAENVRDDIPAMLSHGEYVLPADVVKWHGLKHISEMMMEAKMGLMSLHEMGQIHEVEEFYYDEEEPHSEGVEDAEVSDEDYYSEEGEGEFQEEYETPEGNEVEIAEVITEEEVPEYDDEDEVVETISYAMRSTPKIAFIR